MNVERFTIVYTSKKKSPLVINAAVVFVNKDDTKLHEDVCKEVAYSL